MPKKAATYAKNTSMMLKLYRSRFFFSVPKNTLTTPPSSPPSPPRPSSPPPPCQPHPPPPNTSEEVESTIHEILKTCGPPDLWVQQRFERLGRSLARAELTGQGQKRSWRMTWPLVPGGLVVENIEMWMNWPDDIYLCAGLCQDGRREVHKTYLLNVDQAQRNEGFQPF